MYNYSIAVFVINNTNVMWSRLEVVNLCCFALTQLLFVTLVNWESTKSIIQQNSVLSLRIASMIPAFALICFAESFFPEFVEYFEAAYSIVDGYCFYYMFQLLYSQFSTREQIIASISQSENTGLCFASIQRNHAEVFFQFLNICCMQFLLLRPILLFLYAITSSSSKSQSNLPRLFNALAFVSMVFAFASLVRIYLILNKPNFESIRLGRKILFVKLVVLILAVENAIFKRSHERSVMKNFLLYTVCTVCRILSSITLRSDGMDVMGQVQQFNALIALELLFFSLWTPICFLTPPVAVGAAPVEGSDSEGWLMS